MMRVLLLCLALWLTPALCNPVPSKSEVDPTFICPQGYRKEGGECTKTIYDQPVYTCPPGFESSANQHGGNMRTSERNTQYDKKAKHTHNITDCIRVITTPPRPYCPSGYEMTSALGGEEGCVKYLKEEAETYCSSGYTMRADGCYRSTVHTPSYECVDDAFTMVGQQCQRLLEMKPMEGCPEQHMLADNRCVKVERREAYKVCPRGSVPVSEELCITRVVRTAERICARGYTMEGDNCLKAEIIKSEVKCEEDAEWDGSECVHEKILEAVQKCDDGWTLEADGFCTKVIKKRPTQFCEDGQLNLRTDKCVKMEAILPDFTCPSGFDANEDNDCIKVDVQPVELKCPPRFELNNRECVFEESTAPLQQCPDAFIFIDDSCMRPTYTPKWRRCQNGFNLVGDHCTAVQEMAPQMICPNGFDLKVNQCVEDRRVDHLLRCASVDLQLRRGRCEGREVRASKVDCEAPYAYNTNTRMCEDKESVKPNMHCDGGVGEKNGACIRIERTKPQRRCPDDHYFDNYYNTCKEHKRYVPVRTPVHTAPHKSAATFSAHSSPSHVSSSYHHPAHMSCKYMDRGC
eukprot:GHVS01039793.1.p1 GENE.GHVS01039793.1~~GHVS01039793.1.p1  ORF type:complete len:575 (+),score=96.13 GHVS01039793.1:185-1909(+)